MKPFLSLRRFGFTLAALGVLAFALVVTTPVLAIVNGVRDTENAFPNVGAIVVTKTPPISFPGVPVPQSFSSGTLIHPRVMLTAGHSIAFMGFLMGTDGLTLNDFRVSFRADASQAGHDPASLIEIEALILHPRFVRDNNGEDSLDVGVIILKTPVTGVTPVTLPPAGFLDQLRASGELSVGPDGGTPLLVAGYGVNDPPPNPGFLLPSGIRHWAISEFQALRPRYLHTSQNFAQGEGGVARGDSGGPVFWIDPNTGQLVQLGVTSSGDQANVDLGIFCRTDLPEVLDFLDEVIDLLDP